MGEVTDLIEDAAVIFSRVKELSAQERYDTLGEWYRGLDELMQARIDELVVALEFAEEDDE